MKNMKLNYRLCMVFFTILVIGCENTSVNEVSYSALYADSLELKCDGNMWLPYDQEENWNTYLPAHERMIRHVKFEDNQLSWDFTARDLKISDNIYDFVVDCWRQENLKLKTGKFILKMIENGYFIAPIDKKENSLSRESIAKIILSEKTPIQDFKTCVLFIPTHGAIYLSDYFDYDKMKMVTDGYGCRYITTGFKQKYGYNFTTVYNNCVTYKDYKCEVNYINGQYAYDRRVEGIWIGDVIESSLNIHHKHILSVIASFSKPYSGSIFDFDSYFETDTDTL